MNRHGKITFTWENDLFISKVEGPFNELGLAYYSSEIKKSVISKDFKQWRRIEVWDEESIASPETLNIGKELYDWCKNNGCVLEAIVLSTHLQKHIVKDIFKSKIEIFQNITEAKAWLSAHTDKSVTKNEN
ncbi:hypothetical protein [Cognaticolwellia beringensis]|nr:hypothetical protein [Cognaticolwellia beringensis]